MADPFVTCPYVSAHRVTRSRIQAHIVKCQEKHPALDICPYNATHRMSQEYIRKHVEECPSKANIFPEDKTPKVISHLTIPQPILQKQYLPETDPNHEIWDD